eukprot:621768-Prorocentrum_minimum.AAC.1
MGVAAGDYYLTERCCNRQVVAHLVRTTARQNSDINFPMRGHRTGSAGDMQRTSTCDTASSERLLPDSDENGGPGVV